MTSTKETKRTLVKQLARYKAETGSTYEDLGNELGYTHGAVYNWLSGTYLPTEKNVDTIKIFLASKGMTTPTARLSEATVTELLADLRTIKEREGLSFEELGESIGVSENAVANWFRGVANPSALNAYHIKNFLAGRDKQTNLFENLFETQVQQSDLTLTAEDGTQYVSSRSVAEWTEKQHKHLIRDIENYISYLADDEQNPNLGFGSTMRIEGYFVEDSYQVEEGGRHYKFYWCSRKGCEMIANKMTGKKGVRFTAHYIEVFHAMEQALKADQPTVTPEKLTEPTETAQTASELPQGLREVERLYMDTLAQEIAKTDDMATKMQLAERLTQLVQSMN